MNKELIAKVKEKKELSGLPDSVVVKALEIIDVDDLDEKEIVKSCRAFLRRYFGVFLTNRLLKGKFNGKEVLEIHRSSKERDYNELYKKVLKGDEKVVVDLGCGVNGFSYFYLNEVVSNINYIGIEASGQLVDMMNKYFLENRFNARAIHKDLFDLDFIIDLLKKQENPRVVFLFQVLDALEGFERDFSKKFLLGIKDYCERFVVSIPLRSLSGGLKKAKGEWVLDFVEENFNLIDDFELNGERFIIFE